jgi:hypothetical protein
MFKKLLTTAAIGLTSCSSAFNCPSDAEIFAMDMAWCQGFIARDAVIACEYALCPTLDASACKMPNFSAYRHLPVGRSRFCLKDRVRLRTDP